MQHVIDSLTARPLLSVAVGAFLFSVAMLMVFKQRTRKHRIEQVRRGEI